MKQPVPLFDFDSFQPITNKLGYLFYEIIYWFEHQVIRLVLFCFKFTCMKYHVIILLFLIVATILIPYHSFAKDAPGYYYDSIQITNISVFIYLNTDNGSDT